MEVSGKWREFSGISLIFFYTMPQFRKKPIVIEALQWTGDNHQEMVDFMGTADFGFEMGSRSIFIKTLEGEMKASPGDWIIKGIKGEFYPCKPDIFDLTYDPEPEPYSNSPIQKLVMEQGYRLAEMIDNKVALMIKPRPKYCPNWLYRKIIRESVVLKEVRP
jgi:hypothetical protein